MIYANLRDANVARQVEWNTTTTRLSLAYKANELFGEAGEAANVIKKLERERLGIRGSRDTVEHLAEELADVVICVDLLALEAGLGPIEASLLGNVTLHNLVTGGNRLGTMVGRVCHIVEQPNAIGFHEGLTCALEDVATAVELIAAHLDIDLDVVVADKFNATSEKVGLQTRLAA